MKRDKKRALYQFLGLLVPFMTLVSPTWLSISGVGPRWAELWLLPWALEEGPAAGLFGGFCLGIVLDGINLDGSTQLPALIFLGYWWGCLGRKRKYSNKSFILGSLIFSGSFLSGLSIWLQNSFQVNGNFFNIWAFYTLLAGSIVSGLIAPLLCTLSLNIFFKGNFSKVNGEHD